MTSSLLSPLMVLSTLGSASSFVPNGVGSPGAAFDTHRLSRTAFQLPALVYYDEKMYVEEEFDFFDTQTLEPAVVERAEPIKTVLDYDRVATLARIAVAFSPEETALNLKELANVEVKGLDEYHVDIEAVVRAGESCVTVMVSVPFSEPCVDYDCFEECLIESVNELDYQAVSRLRSVGIPARYAEELPQDWEEIAAEKPVYLPPWWESSVSMDEDIEYVMGLLNDEAFEPDLKALAIEKLSPNQSAEHLVVERAAVIAIGPLGVHLRAQARKTRLFDEDEIIVGEISHTFAEEVNDSASLQAALLDALVSAHDDEEEVLLAEEAHDDEEVPLEKEQ